MRNASRLMRVLLALAILASLSFPAACQRGGNRDIYKKTIEATRAEVWKGINAGKTSSASVAILDGGEIVYSEGFGMADRENSIPATPETVFNVGSVSKTFCATAVMLLVDDGKVELDACAVQYLPAFEMADPRYKDITVRMLLDHSSGLPGTTCANNFGYEYNSEVYEEVLANLAGSHLKAAPGQAAPYCNDGFTLAEMLVAEVSGMEYMDFLTERVFKPLSLERTGLSVGMREGDDMAACYQVDPPAKMPPEVLSIIGAGGLSSTAEDLVRFADSFSVGGKQVLSEESIAEMTKSQPSKLAKAAVESVGINPEASWGLGLDIVDAPYYREKGIKVTGKGGSAIDFHAMMLSVPDERFSVAVVQAGKGNDTSEVGLLMLDSILREKGLLEEEEESVAGPLPSPQPIPKEYAAFSGYYAGSDALYRINIDLGTNLVMMDTLSGDEVVESEALAYRDGLFSADENARHAFISVGSRSYFLNTVFNDRLYMTSAEKIDPLPEPAALADDVNGARWLRRNVKPFEEMIYAGTHILTSRLPGSLPGYVDFSGIRKVESPEFAGMVSDGVRDQTELTLIDKSGEIWAQVSDMLYFPIEGAAPLGSGGEEVTIGEDGYNEWFEAGEDLVVGFRLPAGARVIVFSAEGSSLYDSIIDSGEVFAPAGSFIELAGMPGDILEITPRSRGGR
ncbi:MAG: beta-lactamase family protein [Actinobacteria bacterium]|nr:beta-lactamase family protein [Actinomycetota bacterium]